MGKSIAIAGKGGTGKSTIAAMIISYLRKNGMGPVLAIDADPDTNLSILLGIEPEHTIGDLREQVLKDIKNFPAGMSKANYVESGLHQIIEEYKDLDLVAMGRGEGAGCYCYLNNLIKKFCDDLMPSYPWTVIDNEAGLEHISRRTTSDIDALIIVVNDNPVSLRTAEKVIKITNSVKSNIKKNYIITNAIDERNKEKIQRLIADLKVEYLCDIPVDETIRTIAYDGKSIGDISNPEINNCIKLIINRIE
ncbi:MAG TPA: AAA family ATPase [Victivallales bacterium]|nr:AAA family ATPase [Victivallales bacterium]